MTDNVAPLRRKAREQLSALLAKGDRPLPIVVMLDSMWRWYSEATRLESSTDPNDASPARIARVQAQRCAVDAAPYLHPKLQSTTVSGDDENPLQVEHSVRSAHHDE